MCSRASWGLCSRAAPCGGWRHAQPSPRAHPAPLPDAAGRSPLLGPRAPWWPRGRCAVGARGGACTEAFAAATLQTRCCLPSGSRRRLRLEEALRRSGLAPERQPGGYDGARGGPARPRCQARRSRSGEGLVEEPAVAKGQPELAGPAVGPVAARHQPPRRLLAALAQVEADELCRGWGGRCGRCMVIGERWQLAKGTVLEQGVPRRGAARDYGPRAIPSAAGAWTSRRQSCAGTGAAAPATAPAARTIIGRAARRRREAPQHEARLAGCLARVVRELVEQLVRLLPAALALQQPCMQQGGAPVGRAGGCSSRRRSGAPRAARAAGAFVRSRLRQAVTKMER